MSDDAHHAASWRQVCRAYFRDQDDDARAILSVFDAALAQQPSDTALPDVIKLRLADLGFACSDSGVWELREHVLAVFSDIRSQERSAYHREQQRRAEDRLAKYLLKYARSGSGAPSDEVKPHRRSR